jgi:mono/diheme cytochrome c family protein
MRASRRRLAPVLVGPVALLVACGSGTAGPGAASGTDVARGQLVYDTRCAPCHGSGGGGDGPAAAAIEPKPRNFRDPAFWKGRTRQQLRVVVAEGKPGTLMPPFEGTLSPAEIDDVVAYLESFRPAGS